MNNTFSVKGTYPPQALEKMAVVSVESWNLKDGYTFRPVERSNFNAALKLGSKTSKDVLGITGWKTIFLSRHGNQRHMLHCC